MLFIFLTLSFTYLWLYFHNGGGCSQDVVSMYQPLKIIHQKFVLLWISLESHPNQQDSNGESSAVDD